ncbi:MAG: RelA/SpoT domain-containing protein [Candidatus Bathyarchaeota archaeon]|nr:RelA/SpoT domain-containing protein [Candidatus Bathyarchaeum sp.]
MKKPQKNADKAQKLLDEYKEKFSLFEEYTKSVHFILENLLEKNFIQFQVVQSRTKEPLKFRKKLSKKEYLLKKKLVEMPDLSGCRVIFYLEDFIEPFARILYNEFEVVDDEQKTGAGEYNARHITIKLKENRLSLSEYSRFRDLRCEIQLTTVLYHAWAGLQHDIIYKPNEPLLEFDKPAFDYIGSYFKEIMETHLKEASRDFSFIFHEFKNIQRGQILIDPSVITAYSRSSSNNDMHHFLKLLNGYLVKYLHKLPKGYKLIDALEVALDSAKKNPVVDQETVYGKLAGITYLDIAHDVLDIVGALRYYDIPNKLSLIIKLSAQKELRPKCEEALRQMAVYNIEMVKKYGFYAQKAVFDYVTTQKPEYLFENLDVILALIKPIASLECEDWSMDNPLEVTFRRGCLPPSASLQNLRSRYFELTKSLLALAKTDVVSKKLLNAMFALADLPHFEQISEEINELLCSDITKINDYLVGYYDSAPNVTKMEIQRFTNRLKRLNFRDKIVNLCKLEEKLEKDTNFATFKIFYGSDIDFYPDFDFRKAEAFRKQKVNEFMQQIQEENFEEWLSFLKEVGKDYTSDKIGSYQYFIMLLRELAENKPNLALGLLDVEALLPFLSHILGGLLNSSELEQIRGLLTEYSKDEAKQLATVQALLSKRVFDECLFEELYPNLSNSKETTVLLTLLDTIVGNYSSHKDHKDKASDIINKFTAMGFFSWSAVYFLSTDFWKEFTDDGIKAILGNLKYSINIGYEEESMLSPICEKKPKAIVNFFHERVMLSKSKKFTQPLPFEFHVIKDNLSKNGQEILPEIIKWFSEQDSFVDWYAAKFIHNVFPSFAPSLERFLLDLVRKHTKKNLRIVLHILKRYDGQPFLHKVVKEIIKGYPLDEKLKNNIYYILSEVRALIGGEWGYRDALKQKMEETKDWLTDANAEIREFAGEYHKYLEKRIAHEEDRVKKESTFRKRDFDLSRK